MNKNYNFNGASHYGWSVQGYVVALAITFFCLSFTQAQETLRSSQALDVPLVLEKARQPINPGAVRNTGRYSTASFTMGESGTTINGKSSFDIDTVDTPAAAATECAKGAIATVIDDVYGNLNTYSYADDFIVAPDEVFYLEEIELVFLLDYDVTAEEMFLTFHEDRNGNGPGTEIPFSEEGVQVNMENMGEYENTIKDVMLITVTFPTPIAFYGGAEGASYWAGARITHTGGPNSAAAVGTSSMSGSQTFYVKPANAWIKSTVAYENVPPQDLIVSFYGQCDEYLGVDDNHTMAEMYLFPNPLSRETLYIHAPFLDGKWVDVTVNDMAGRQVLYQPWLCENGQIAISRANSLRTGVYVVSVRQGSETSTYKLVVQ